MESLQWSTDRRVAEFMQTLVMCSPETRRKLSLLLNQLDSPDSLHPVSMTNPQVYTLRAIERGFYDEVGPEPPVVGPE